MLCLLILLIQLTQQIQIDEEYLYRKSDIVYWKQHIAVYGLANDFGDRFHSFRQNLNFIRKFNSKNNSTFFLKLNQFAHLTTEEFKSYRNCIKKPHTVGKTERQFYTHDSEKKLPKSVDWRKLKTVSRIKNQGPCGSCWAFSNTESIEAMVEIYHHKIITLSEQQLVDCAQEFNSAGCNGGQMTSGFLYSLKYGIVSESKYQYHAVDQTCKKLGGGFKIKSISDIGSPKGLNLKKALAYVGPVSVAIDASQETFRFYGGGVYYDPNCSSDDLDHAVLAVGYNHETPENYYDIKNSWGETWGENGFIKVLDFKNHCGVNTDGHFPNL